MHGHHIAGGVAVAVHDGVAEVELLNDVLRRAGSAVLNGVVLVVFVLVMAFGILEDEHVGHFHVSAGSGVLGPNFSVMRLVGVGVVRAVIGVAHFHRGGALSESGVHILKGIREHALVPENVSADVVIRAEIIGQIAVGLHHMRIAAQGVFKHHVGGNKEPGAGAVVFHPEGDRLGNHIAVAVGNLKGKGEIKRFVVIGGVGMVNGDELLVHIVAVPIAVFVGEGEAQNVMFLAARINNKAAHLMGVAGVVLHFLAAAGKLGQLGGVPFNLGAVNVAAEGVINMPAGHEHAVGHVEEGFIHLLRGGDIFNDRLIVMHIDIHIKGSLVTVIVDQHQLEAQIGTHFFVITVGVAARAMVGMAQAFILNKGDFAVFSRAALQSAGGYGHESDLTGRVGHIGVGDGVKHAHTADGHAVLIIHENFFAAGGGPAGIRAVGAFKAQEGLAQVAAGIGLAVAVQVVGNGASRGRQGTRAGQISDFSELGVYINGNVANAHFIGIALNMARFVGNDSDGFARKIRGVFADSNGGGAEVHSGGIVVQA